MHRRTFTRLLGSSLAAAPFVSPVSLSARTEAPVKRLRAFIAHAFPNRLRPPNGNLPHPYIDPGAAYTGILWDWDAYFSLKGLAPWKEQVAAAAVGCVRNFLAFQAEDGSVPYALTPKSGVHGPRPVDSDRNSAKPLLAQFALMAADYSGDDGILEESYAGLARHCAHWEESQGTELGLLTFRTHRGSGVDDHPAVYCRPQNSSADVYLNCLMIQEYRAMAEVARRSRQDEPAQWEEKVKALAEAIETHMWDPIDRCYYNLEVGRHVPGKVNQPVSWVVPLKVKSWTSLMPLWAQVASKERAKLMVEQQLMNEARLLAPHGMRSLAKDEPAYEVKVSSNPSCWRGPIWVVNNYLVNQGLRHYGFEAEARELAGRLQRMLVRDLDANGELHEYYDPETGAGLTHPGFLNWNTLAGVM